MSEDASRDMFSELPVEVIYNILSYLNAFHAGIRNGTGLHYREVVMAQQSNIRRVHPFLSLAATSRRLRDVVESHCQSLLLQYKSINTYKPIDQGLKLKKKQRTSYRGYWRKFTRRKCAFCGKPTQRGAMFNCLIHCCQQCDASRWPARITRSTAVQKYKLALEDLINPEDNHIIEFEPESGRKWPGAQASPLKAWPQTNLKTLRHALYRGPGYETTMFFEHDVKERAAVMRGDCLVGDSVDLSKRKEVANAGLKGKASTNGKGKQVASGIDDEHAEGHLP